MARDEGDIVQRIWSSRIQNLLKPMHYIVQPVNYDPRPNVASAAGLPKVHIEKTAILPVEIDLDEQLDQTARTNLIAVRPSRFLWRPTFGMFTVTNPAGDEEWEVLSVRRLAQSDRGEVWEFIAEGNVCP